MAQQDATEQVKEFLRQVIKYRFWISVSIAALFAVIAYFMGHGPVQAKVVQATNDIKGAKSGVEKFNSPTIPTEAYKPIVEEKTQIVNKDVSKAWKELYDRQAPLLTWPETVQDRFRKWGRDGRRMKIRRACNWRSSTTPTLTRPMWRWSTRRSTHSTTIPARGSSPPPKETLLRPVVFSDTERPDLGKVWAAQERLWIQHTVLEVIAQVNEKAKNWDTAIVKQIESLEVGNPLAQDQRSLANAEELKKADEILAPGQESSEAAAEVGGGGSGSMGGGAGAMSMMMGRRGGMGGGMGSMGGPMGGGGGAGSQYDNTIYYITPANDKGQFKILPILVSVLIDQDHVQDFLVDSRTRRWPFR